MTSSQRYRQNGKNPSISSPTVYTDARQVPFSINQEIITASEAANQGWDASQSSRGQLANSHQINAQPVRTPIPSPVVYTDIRQIPSNINQEIITANKVIDRFWNAYSKR